MNNGVKAGPLVIRIF